jgi:carboxylesterase
VGGRQVALLSPDLPDASPFEADGRAPACLLLHGFTGTPFEVRPIGEGLARAGFRVRAPLLPGPGTDVEDLMDRRRKEWCDASEEAALALAREGPIVLVGLSLGALLALRIAAVRPQIVLGVVALAPALRLMGWTAWPLAALSRLRAAPRIGIPKMGGSDIRDPAMRSRNPSYLVQPLRGAVQLYRLAREVEGMLGRVSAPILCIHGARDRTVPPSATDEVLRRVASAERHKVVLPESGHVLPLDVERAKVVSEVIGFVERLAATLNAG